jgi:threonine dehydrogenase-like Zn-dependent dehydrogenase
MTRRKILLTSARGLVAAMAASFAGPRLVLAVGPDQEQAELANALSSAKVNLPQGLNASESEGQPISGKFELEGGKLQLSVYTAKEGKFFEVIVDHMTGKITKVEPIAEGEDLAQAKSQKAAVDKAKVKLADAAIKSMGEAKGPVGDVIVVSAVPELNDNRPEAVIVLLTGKQFSTVKKQLD